MQRSWIGFRPKDRVKTMLSGRIQSAWSERGASLGVSRENCEISSPRLHVTHPLVAETRARAAMLDCITSVTRSRSDRIARCDSGTALHWTASQALLTTEIHLE